MCFCVDFCGGVFEVFRWLFCGLRGESGLMGGEMRMVGGVQGRLFGLVLGGMLENYMDFCCLLSFTGHNCGVVEDKKPEYRI